MAAETDNTKKRSIAEDMYIYTGVTGRDIADLLGVTEQTVSRWKKGREGEKSWDERKTEVSLTPGKVREILMKEAHKIAKGEASAVDADKLSKVVAAIDKLDKKISVRIAMDVLKDCDNYIAEIEPKKAIELTKYHKLYLQYRVSLEA